MPTVPKYKLKPLNLDIDKIGQRIAYLRKGKGLTQAELGEKIGISQKLVAAYENGHIRMYDEMIARFAIALGVTADNILGLKKTDQSKNKLSLRVSRRFNEIENLPELRKKAILRTLDDLIRANK